MDRSGAKILIKKLIKNKAVGLVSTHDLELGVLEEESHMEIRNYHLKSIIRVIKYTLTIEFIKGYLQLKMPCILLK